jgi:hypothetical protein
MAMRLPVPKGPRIFGHLNDCNTYAVSKVQEKKKERKTKKMNIRILHIFISSD